MAIWREDLYARDRLGRFMSRGFHVQIAAGLRGIVVNTKAKKANGITYVEVKDYNGRMHLVPADRIDGIQPPAGSTWLGDGKAGRIGDVVQFTDQAGRAVIKRIGENGAVTVGHPRSNVRDKEVDPGSIVKAGAADPRLARKVRPQDPTTKQRIKNPISIPDSQRKISNKKIENPISAPGSDKPVVIRPGNMIEVDDGHRGRVVSVDEDGRVVFIDEHGKKRYTTTRRIQKIDDVR